ncbi:MAG: SusC/RagA family TonB-linked outer membrane protein [Longimonas sp.]|uniref:SusC/RagA family TonB-linked outer membrane protein n=1 Tax=Longimonas sp. TaxID=2039626 RepID=UPI0039767417
MLRTTFFTILVFALLGVGNAAWAQEDGTITGTVLDSETEETVPGANVVIDELQQGAATDAQGAFELGGIEPGDYTLTVSYLGYQSTSTSVTVEAGETTEVEIMVTPDAVQLDDVVVTALGIERDERSLGYSVQEVSGDDISGTGETNFMSNLQGRIAGADISTSNSMGGSARILLRGARSVSGNNQPLIVVDGTPLDNSNFTSGGQAGGGGGYDYGNAAQMINPDNVESVSVLKGPNAAALYGARAANGVIEVTTKSGEGLAEGSIGINVNTSASTKQVYGLPDYQNTYGGGSWRPFSMNGDGQYVVDFGTDQSWGPRLDGREVRQWYSYDEVNGLFGETTPWEANPDNVENYFDTGTVFNTSVSFAQGGENFNYRASVKNVMEDGVYPNSSLDRNEVSFNGSLDLSERLSTNLQATYTNTQGEGRPGTGYDGRNVFQQFNHFGQRQLELGDGSPMTDYERPDGSQRGWNWTGGEAGAEAGDLIYFDNPYWVQFNNFQEDENDRVYGGIGLSYDVSDDLQLSTNARSDIYTDRRQERVAVGSTIQDQYREEIRQVREVNANVQADYNTQLSDEFSLDAYAGSDYRYNSYDLSIGNTEGGLSLPEVYTLENSISRPSITDFFEERKLVGAYGNATVGYNDLVYVEGSLRNDWSSTLPEGENSYLYPSINGSFVFGDLNTFEDTDLLSSGKVRVGWAQVGNDTDPYQLLPAYDQAIPFRGNPVQSVPGQLNNPDLKPEITTSIEAGLELGLFEDRLGLDVSAYRDISRDQILPVEVSRASGYQSLLVNAGEIENQGVELALNGTPIVNEDMRWDVTVNWATNSNEVIELDEDLGLESYTIGGTPFGPDVVARVGEPYGTLYGTGYEYDDEGNIILDSNGIPVTSAPKSLGSYTPDWTAGLQTSFSYKSLNVSASLSGQKGGNIYSVTNMFGMYSGLVEETVEGDVREVGIVPDGVYENENGELVEWTGRVDPNAFSISGFFGNNEANTFDATHIKLQSVSIGYTLPDVWFDRTPIQNLTVRLQGSNLATLYKKTPHFDPATALSATNVQGVEAGQIPPQRTYGFSLNMQL